MLYISVRLRYRLQGSKGAREKNLSPLLPCTLLLYLISPNLFCFDSTYSMNGDNPCER